MQLFRDAGILVLDPKAYISTHERKDAMHPKDTPSNRYLQAKLFFHAAVAARSFGRIKEIRLGLLSAPHSFEAWPDTEATTVGGNSDSHVKDMINEIERMMLCVAKRNATSFMSSENVSKAEASKAPEAPLPRSTATTASSVATPPRTEAKASAWKPAWPTAPSTLPPLASAQRVVTKSGRGETSAGTAAAAPQSYHIPLPGCGHRELSYLSKRATGVLRHRPMAKQFPDGMIPLRAFCESFDNGRTPSSCLTVLVLGSNKVRFQIRVTRLVNVSFFEHLRDVGQTQLENEFKKIIGYITHIGAVQGHTFATDLSRHRELPESVRTLYHGTSETAWKKILRDSRGLVPGGNGSGRTESYFSSRAPWEAGVTCDGDVPGYRFTSDVTIVYDRSKAELRGVKFKLAISDAILTRFAVPVSSAVAVVRNYDKKLLWTMAAKTTVEDLTVNSRSGLEKGLGKPRRRLLPPRRRS